MIDIPQQFHITTNPMADPRAIVRVSCARFTVLTSRLIRMEYSQEDAFEDRPSQVFWHRQQPVPDYEVLHSGSEGMSGDRPVEIKTEHLHLRYSGREFAANSLSIELRGKGILWHCGDPDPGNLGGTARTLDEVCGKTNLEMGLISRSGWSVVDDTHSLLFNENGWLEARNILPGTADIYFFGYGSAYQDCLTDFQKVAGKVPVIPRWVLGNWWSRYWAYSQEELTDLMYDFKEHQVPLSVCIIDMDWHLDGWTGYTWNKKLIPDPDGFLRDLHDLGLKTALNLHPADGVGPHEEMYLEMAEATGIDPASKQPVRFNIEDPVFLEPYFEILHHPKEERGIDFWWMDWQQGNPTTLPGLNLLWWINHLHFHDLGRDGKKRPFVFSRWGGLGNHRYPIGFSGDTIVTWESLAFQPYFTATAANVSYGWWSHDIGGHMNGIEDAELYTRWVQFGVFSPIMRLHSTKNPYHERRPFGYDAETFRITQSVMQLRHSLIPYLYSMSWRNYMQGVPLIRPMYHEYPDVEDAYACPNQYTYGSELVAAPFIARRDPDTRLSRQIVWLPEGEWFDFFSGRLFTGGGWQTIYGALDEIPVFAKAGAIVPLGPMQAWGGVDNPRELIVHVFPGADNRFDLYEDDGISNAYLQGDYAVTPFIQEWHGNHLVFKIIPASGQCNLLPEQRSTTLVFHNIVKPDQVEIQLNGQAALVVQTFDPEKHSLTLVNIQRSPSDPLSIYLSTDQPSLIYRADPRPPMLRKLLKAFRLGTEAKYALDSCLEDVLSEPGLLGAYLAVLTKPQMRALLEVITGTGVEHITTAGEELIILWNNHNDPGFTYQISKEWLSNHRPKERFELQKGTVPQFMVFHPKEDWIYPNLLEVNYRDLLKTVIPYGMKDIYPRPEAGSF